MLKSKIKSLKVLKTALAGLRKKGKKIVFTNGCFDILHYGHARYLEDAKKRGDILVVAVNSDSSVRRIKGDKRPVVTQKDRISLVASLESVDYSIILNDSDPLRLIKEIKPDVLVKGADWSRDNIVGADFVLSYGGKVSTIKLAKGRSSTNLIKKIASIY